MNFLINKLNDKKVFDLWNIRQEEYSDIYDEIVENQKKLCLDEKRNHIVVKSELNFRKQLKGKWKSLLFQKYKIFLINFGLI